MSDFGGRQYGLGVVRGVRSFDVDEFGRLKGVQYPTVWKPGENTAVCNRKKPAEGWTVDQEATSAFGSFRGYTILYRNDVTGVRGVAKPPMVPELPDGHSLTDCSHGFYAYYDGSNDYRSDSRISAVVEGYGDTLIGTRGFRAEKARIVALCIPGSEPAKTDEPPVEKLRWRDRAWFAGTVWSVAVGGAAGWATHGVTYMVEGAPLWLTIPWTAVGVAATVGAFLVPIQFRPRAKKRKALEVELRSSLYGPTVVEWKPVADGVAQKVRRNYPDVQVFTRFEDMIAAFPPDKGLEPSPETDPNFWTVS